MEKNQYSTAEMALMEQSSIPFTVFQFIDNRTVPLVFSKGFLKLFDLKRDDVRSLMDFDMFRDVHPDDKAGAANAVFRFAAENEPCNIIYRVNIQGDYWIIHARGEYIYPEPDVRLGIVWFANEGRYGSDPSGNGSDLAQTFSKVIPGETLNYKNYYDRLTGLPNMTGFLELAEPVRKSMAANGNQPAIVFFNINGMKFYNRNYGFNKGDHLLRQFAQVLASHFGSNNCSRFGMDIFSVLTEASGIEAKLNDIFLEFSQIDKVGNISVRAGIAIDNDPERELSSLCDYAKYACDVNRGAFLSCFKYFDESMLANVEKRRYIIDNLDRALREKWIKVYYQPIVRTANGRVSDEEALARWIDPVKGYMVPSDFIPTLESVKLIYKLDLYVVEEVLRKIKIQAEKGLEVVPISINFSRTDFDACDLVEEIRKRVDDAGVSRDKITIEITESVVGSELDFIKEQVERFQNLGFKVWMDDFGSGYSSLDVLQSIRFDLIKFDMRFMQRFDDGDESKIILTELMKMAIALGVDTLTEGVERQDQLEFLKEVGCTKAQGYYYTKPIPMEQVIERYEKGIQIGFENPQETEYYSAIGRINLYDTALIAREDQASFRRYFDTLPMNVLESNGDRFRVIRCNQSFREFSQMMNWNIPVDRYLDYEDVVNRPGLVFMKLVRQCGIDGTRVIIDDVMPNGATVHAFIKRVAVNPVTGTAAIAIVVLGVMDADSQKAPLTYVNIAQALSSDYFDLFYINLETEEFIQYSSDGNTGNISVERHGSNFFEEVKIDAKRILYEPDLEMFLKAFTKENVIKGIDANEAFSLTYRQMYRGKPVYVNLKAVRVSKDDHYIIVGVNNIDAQMKQREAFERIKQERLTYSRMAALAGDLICIYMVDPVTDEYSEYSVTAEYEGLGLAKKGENFFEKARIDALHAVYLEDVDRFLALFSKEKVLKSIEESNIYGLRYRLLIDGKPKYVSLKAAFVDEDGGKRMIIGVHNIDARLRRDHEYEQNIAIANAKVNIDPLTGLKSKHAYDAVTEQLDEQINERHYVEFAIAVFGMSALLGEKRFNSNEEEIQWSKQAGAVIGGIFKRSPVFHFDKDEIVIIAQGQDYHYFDELIGQVKLANQKNELSGGIFIPYGAAKYDRDLDCENVMRRAVEALKSEFHS